MYPNMCCVRLLANAQESFMLVLIAFIYHTFSVNSQNTFLSADFVCNKCLVLIQTCSRTSVDLQSHFKKYLNHYKRGIDQ